MTSRQWLVFTAIVGLLVSTGGAQSRVPDDMLLDMLVWGSHVVPAGIQAFDGPLNAEVASHLRRSAAYRSARSVPPERDGLLTMGYSAQVSYERRLAATAVGPDVARLAEAYATALRPCHEWEGFSDCPEREALFADAYQAGHPAGPFSSYLPLLSAHRWLCAAEAFEREGRSSDVDRARTLFAERLSVALASSSVLIRSGATRLSTRAQCYAP